MLESWTTVKCQRRERREHQAAGCPDAVVGGTWAPHEGWSDGRWRPTERAEADPPTDELELRHIGYGTIDCSLGDCLTQELSIIIFASRVQWHRVFTVTTGATAFLLPSPVRARALTRGHVRFGRASRRGAG